MIRTISKATFLAAAVLAAGTAVVNCSHKGTSDVDVSAVSMNLTLSPGVTINTVHYAITGNAIPAPGIQGDIDVTNQTVATALVGGIAPNANPYTITMTATSTDGLTSCTGTSTFTAVAGQTAVASVTLQCRGRVDNTVQVAVTGRLDNCPFITGVSASALTARVGSAINIGVNATDFDAADVITTAWTANPTGIGSFGSATAASTTFTCTAVGATQLSVAVSDSVCGDSRNNVIPVTCTAAGGTGGVGGSAPPVAGSGGSAPPVAGSGGSAPPVAGSGGSAPPVAGSGGSVGGSGGSVGGAGGSVVGMFCPDGEPYSGTQATCCSCTTDNCSLGPTPGTDGCQGLSDPTDRQLCQTLAACIATNSATCTASGDPTRCFCGTNDATCFTTVGAANGPCAAQFVAASKTTDPVQIQARFVSPNFPSGRAVNLTACRGSFCSAECAIQ